MPEIPASSSSKSRLPSKASKRSRGEIACAECRRLKIRCDRNIPCNTCTKRGCASLCPNGTIPPGEGSRFVYAATEHLRGKLERLEARMHSLEDALAIAQASSELAATHPLLSRNDDDGGQTLLELHSSEGNENLSDVLGTLFIEKDGASLFFGPSGGSESLLWRAKQPKFPLPTQSPPELDTSYLPIEIIQCYQSFPLTLLNHPTVSVQQMIESFLPPVERAIELCNTFLEHLSWMFQIVSRQQMIVDVIPAIYKKSDMPYGPHDLALMLIVIGIGTLVDLTQQPYNIEAQHYYILARASAALQPVLAEQSVVTIKVLHLMSIYNGLSGMERNLEQCYALLNLAGQVAVRIGFHVDPSMWGFEGKEAYDRRVYFWNLLQGSLWQSLVTGRPPSILSDYIDCRIPSPEDEETFQQGEVPTGFGIWGFRATADCLLHVVRATLAAKPPPYDRVMELDQKIRAITPVSDTAPQDNRTAISMRAFVRSHYQDLMLLFLHRAFFAQAMTEMPHNPLSSPYGSSVIAAYKSACIVLDDTRKQYIKQPLLCARIWRIWTFAFSAAVIVGTVAIQGRDMNLTPEPLGQFQTACDVFRSVAQTSSRAAKAMPVLETMLQKALQPGGLSSSKFSSDTHSSSSKYEEISIFGGRTTLVHQCHDQALPERSSEIRAATESPSTSINPSKKSNRLATVIPSTFADLSRGWDGMFHETPLPSGREVPHVDGERYLHDVASSWGTGSMPLDDRWSSFMHNYSILDVPSLPDR